MLFTSMDEVKTANDAIGGHWFDPQTMNFFRSKVETVLIDGRWFVSSEQDGDRPRRYTVRAVAADGAISNIGEFGQYATLAEALMGLGEHLAAVNQ